MALGLLACAVAGWGDRFERFATPLAFIVLLGVVVSVFPDNANHQYLMLCLLLLLCLARTSGPEAAGDAQAALGAMRWIALGGVVWAGVMKLVYGYWLGGEFLSFRVATDPGFTRTLGLLVPGEELARLVGLGIEVGAGPFRANAPLLVAVSNLTWILEIGLPLGLLWPRTRTLALIATIGLFVAIQLSAREVFFGGLMVGLLLLFDPRNRLARALPWIATVYVGWLLHADLQRLITGGQGG